MAGNSIIFLLSFLLLAVTLIFILVSVKESRSRGFTGALFLVFTGYHLLGRPHVAHVPDEDPYMMVRKRQTFKVWARRVISDTIWSLGRIVMRFFYGIRDYCNEKLAPRARKKGAAIREFLSHAGWKAGGYISSFFNHLKGGCLAFRSCCLELRDALTELGQKTSSRAHEMGNAMRGRTTGLVLFLFRNLQEIFDLLINIPRYLINGIRNITNVIFKILESLREKLTTFEKQVRNFLENQVYTLMLETDIKKAGVAGTETVGIEITAGGHLLVWTHSAIFETALFESASADAGLRPGLFPQEIILSESERILHVTDYPSPAGPVRRTVTNMRIIEFELSSRQSPAKSIPLGPLADGMLRARTRNELTVLIHNDRLSVVRLLENSPLELVSVKAEQLETPGTSLKILDADICRGLNSSTGTSGIRLHILTDRGLFSGPLPETGQMPGISFEKVMAEKELRRASSLSAHSSGLFILGGSTLQPLRVAGRNLGQKAAIDRFLSAMGLVRFSIFSPCGSIIPRFSRWSENPQGQWEFGNVLSVRTVEMEAISPVPAVLSKTKNENSDVHHLPDNSKNIPVQNSHFGDTLIATLEESGRVRVYRPVRKERRDDM